MKKAMTFISVMVLLVAATAMPADADTITNLASHSGRVWDTDFDGNGNSRIGNGGYLSVGEINEHMDRGFVMFTVAALGVGNTLESATLRLYLLANAEDAYDAELDHMGNLNSTTAFPAITDFQAAATSQVTSSFVSPGDIVNTWYEVDVTDAVQWDIDNDTGTTYATFRLNLSTEEDRAYHRRYDFAGAVGYSETPELILEVVPEPATLGLLGIGGLLAMVRKNRK